MTRRIYSLEAVRRAALSLSYVSKRQLLAELARAVLECPPIFNGRPAHREDIAENIVADIRSLAQPELSARSFAAQCTDSPLAERQPDAGAPERAPRHYQKRRKP